MQERRNRMGDKESGRVKKKGDVCQQDKGRAEETRAIKASGIIEEQSLNEPVCGRGAGGR
jgi:hypothetical protein